jgi:hypothetical protein
VQTAVGQPPDAPQIPVVLVGELVAVLVAGAVLSEALRLRTLQETVGVQVSGMASRFSATMVFTTSNPQPANTSFRFRVFAPASCSRYDPDQERVEPIRV